MKKTFTRTIKTRVSEEEKTELSTICRQLKLPAVDGKKYATDCSDTKGILRIIQSIPSPKAEPSSSGLLKLAQKELMK